jgi:hypothetical protein
MQVRLWWGLEESMFLQEPEVRCRAFVGAFGGNLASVALKIFSHLISFMKRICVDLVS